MSIKILPHEGVTEVTGIPVKSIVSNRDFIEKFGVKRDRLHRMVLIILSLHEDKSIDLPKLPAVLKRVSK